MTLIEERGDVFDVDAEGLILTVDGDHPRMMGNVAHKLQRRMTDDAWEDLVDDLDSPIPWGTARHVELPEPVGTFKHVFVLSMLDHVNSPPRASRPDVLRSCLIKALTMAAKLGLTRVASGMLRCGWRIDETMALAAMRSAAEEVPKVTLILRSL